MLAFMHFIYSLLQSCCLFIGVFNCDWLAAKRADGLFFEPREDAMVMEDVVLVTVELGDVLREALIEIFHADGALFGKTRVESY